VSCSNDCTTTESHTIPILESSYGNILSCSRTNHSSDVVKWSLTLFTKQCALYLEYLAITQQTHDCSLLDRTS